ncbi:MAG: hypothetical protein JNK05_14610 [Myxococcales bacterium]|nr:hypothetical protein [Myxococcales bacterium]
MLLRRVACLAALSVVASSQTARADWPMIGQNPQRTARASGTARLSRPAIAWRHYLGGSVAPNQLLVENVEGDARNELVFIASGKLVAKRPDDTLLWETAPLGLFRIDGIADFDGDGEREIVATGSPGLVVLVSARSGRLLWRTRPTDFSPRIGEVRIARIDADATPDLYVADMASSQLQPRPESMFGFSFARGFGSGVDDGSARLWTLPTGRDYAASFNDVVADLDNDGVPEVVAFGTRYAYLYNGRTGQKINATGADTNGGFSLGFALPFGLVTTQVLDVDGDGRLDIVGLSNNTYPLPDNSRHAFVLSYDPSRPAAQRLYVRWSRAAMNLVSDAHEFVEHSAVDLDGDGSIELVTTFREAGSRVTYVLSASTGTVRGSIAGTSLLGVVSLGATERPVVLVRRGAMIEGYRGAALTSGAVSTPAFTIADGTLPRYVDTSAGLGGSARNLAVTAPLPSNPAQRALVLVRGGAIEVFDPRGSGALTAVARYALPADTSAVAVVPQQNVVTMGQGLLVAQSDGYIVVLDPMLRALNQGGTPEFPERGVRSGGFYSGPWGLGPIPTAGRFDSEPVNDIVTNDGRGVLLRIRAAGASLSVAPRVTWEWRGARFPLLDDENRDGTIDRVVAQESGAIVARMMDGRSEVFRTTAVTSTQAFTGDTVPLRGASPAYAAPVNGNDGIGQIVAVRAGSVAWRTTGIATGSSIPGYIAVDRLDADTNDDLLVTFGPMKLYSGASGSLLASSRINTYSAMPITVRGLSSAGSITNLFAASGAEPGAVSLASPVSADFDETWRFRAPFGALRVFGAVVQCGTTLKYLQPPEASARLAIVDVATHRTDSAIPSVVLAGGRLFATEAEARAATPIVGSLGNVSTTQDLGDGRVAALVGSTDGFLYAVDPCASSLIWSVNFRAGVGQPILADTDGDGLDEVVVTAADGFLYGVDSQAFEPPTAVRDINVGDPAGAADIDETRGQALAAEWTAVAGATGYEYAVFTSGGTAITRNAMTPSNPFIQVRPDVLRASHSEGLRDGGRYFFAVRALGPTGASPEVVSDGTVFYRVTPSLDGGGVDAAMPDAQQADSSATSDGGVPTIDGAPSTDAGRDGGTSPAAPSGCGCRAPAQPRRPTGAIVGVVALCASFARRHARRRTR